MPIAAPPPWYSERHPIESIGQKGRASFERFVHEKFGVILYLFWQWNDGWYLELHGHGLAKRVGLLGTGPDAPYPGLPDVFFEEAHQLALKWERD